MKIKNKALEKKENMAKKYLLNKPDSLPIPDYVEEFKKNNKERAGIKDQIILIESIHMPR